MKIQELQKLIVAYENKLREQGYYDDILLLAQGLWILEKIKDKNTLYMYMMWLKDCQFGMLEDLEMTDLEASFMEKLFTFTEIQCQKLEFYTGTEQSSEYRFFHAYGIVNEVRYVIEDILEKGYPFDKVNIFYTSGAYEPFIRSGFDRRGIACHFATGENISSKPFVQLLLALLEYAKEDYLYALLNPVMENPLLTFQRLSLDEEVLDKPLTCFNHFIRKGIGWGRKRYLDCIAREEKDENTKKKYEGYLQFLKDLLYVFEENDCGTLYHRLLDFAAKYTNNKNMERNLILSALKEDMAVFERMSDQKDQKESIRLIEEHLKTKTIKNMEKDRGSVQVMKIQNLEVLERPYQYVIGLSAKQFQADTTESPVLSDDELERYLTGTLHLARDNGKRLTENLKHSLETLNNGWIVMGYSTFDTVELKESSPSVFYLDYEDKYGKNENAYITYPVRKETIMICNHVEEDVENTVAEQQVSEEKDGGQEEIEQENKIISLSPSGLQTLIKCPLSYYYQYELLVPRREFQGKEAHQWLNPANKGNLFHRTMEEYCTEQFLNKDFSEIKQDRNAFERIYQSALQQMAEEQAYSSEEIYRREAAENEKMIWNYLEDLQEEFRADYAEDKKWRILGLELPFDQLLYSVKDPLGEKNDIQIGFKGSIDRLDAYLEKDGILWLRVIDYKTGKPSTKKTEIIADVQIQHVVYALAAEKYAKEHKKELENLFGGTIQNIALESAWYVFPHKKDEERILDVDKIKKIKDRSGKVFEMPLAVTQLLWNVFDEKNYAKKEPDRDFCRSCTYKRQCLKKIGTEM